MKKRQIISRLTQPDEIYRIIRFVEFIGLNYPDVERVVYRNFERLGYRILELEIPELDTVISLRETKRSRGEVHSEIITMDFSG